VKILVTGFEPFGGEKINPSYQAVKLLPEKIAGAEIIKLEIPTAFGRCRAAVETGILIHRPEAVLCVGQAGGRSCVTVERLAINLADARIPDNDGARPVDQPVQPNGPAAYFATVPVKAMVKNVREHSLPCQLSYTAGTYVCNWLMYSVLHMAAQRFPNLRAGFLHVPYLPEQTVDRPGVPSAALETIAKSLKLAIEAVVQTPEDIQEEMGSIC